jgi:hypothetical protein
MKAGRRRLRPEFDADYMAQLRSFLLAEKACGETDFSQGRRMVPRARPDAARQGARRDLGAGSLSRSRAGAWAVLQRQARRAPAAQPCATSTRNCNRTLASNARATAFLSIGRSRACCCSTACSPLKWPRRPRTKARAGNASPMPSSGWSMPRTNRSYFMLWGAYAQKKAAFVDTGQASRAEGGAPLTAYPRITASSAADTSRSATPSLQSKGLAPIDWSAARSLRASPCTSRRHATLVPFADYMTADLHARCHFAIFDGEGFIGKFELADLFDHRQILVHPVDGGTHCRAELGIVLQFGKVIFHPLPARPFERPFGIGHDQADDVGPLVARNHRLQRFRAAASACPPPFAARHCRPCR